jgi:hypothetical protein
MRTRALGWVLLVIGWTGCGASSESTLRPEQWRMQLRDAMGQPVPTREKREELSRVLADAAENGEIERMTRPDVRAAFGEGASCDALPLCGDQGFLGSDWYYLIGTDPDPKIKQLPVLIVGFDTHDRVSRVYTLTTH